MFDLQNPFKSVHCPEGSKCVLVNCIFGHDFNTKEEASPGGADRKRQKLDNGSKSVSKHSEPFTGRLVTDKGAAVASPIDNQLPHKQPIRPQTKAKKEQGRTQKDATPLKQKSVIAKPASLETLNPRMLPNAPAAHTVRLALLKIIHGEMDRLNKLVAASDEPSNVKEKLLLSSNALITLALIEEEKVAKAQPTVYRSIMGHMVSKLKKMELQTWITQREEKLADEDKAKANTKPGSASATPTQITTLPMPVPLPDALKTDLTPEQELHLLARYHIDLQGAGGGLDKHSYILAPPTDVEVAETRRALRMADGWEQCDRCGTRFQVFPNRREGDGALTTGGKCQYHWGKPYREKGTKEALRQCCGQPVGTPGCTTHETHVFKTSDKRRLAGLWEFVATPENDGKDEEIQSAISFDCEMAYTTHGLEIVRISATKWPRGEALIDVLVKPFGHILDLNTRFSGVTPEQYLDAPKWASSVDSLPATRSTPLAILPDPPSARSLLLSHISPSTVLMGHAIENDLTTLRLIHPTIVDTALIYPHPAGLPYRTALRRLAKDVLGLSIQVQTDQVKEGKEGHDSLEDARATGWLVNAKVRSDWKKLVAAGWSLNSPTAVNETVEPKRAWFVPPENDGTNMSGLDKAGQYTISLKDWWK